MKKYFLTLALCIGVLSARASYLPSNLTIRMWDFSSFSVVFDGTSYSQTNGTITLSNVAGGSHFLKVLKHHSHGNGHGYGNSVPRVIFSGFISIAPGKSISGMISHECRFVILSEYSMIPAGGNHYGNHHGNPHYDNDAEGPFAGNNPPNNYNEYNFEPVGMSEYDFMALKSVVASTSFDDTKLTICKQAINSNSVTSRQVCDLMMMLTFESGKLDLAKFAYHSVVDKSRYYLVNNAFTFSSSIDELNRYIVSY